MSHIEHLKVLLEPVKPEGLGEQSGNRATNIHSKLPSLLVLGDIGLIRFVRAKPL
jgi:hypothetical protein